jgi:hypothetical protein
MMLLYCMTTKYYSLLTSPGWREIPRGVCIFLLLAIFKINVTAPLFAQASVEASVTPAQVKAGEDNLITYSFKILRGSPTVWRVTIPWSRKNIYAKSVEKNDQGLWLINQPASSPRSSVVSWIFEPSQNYLELKSYPGDLGVNDVMKVVFAVHVPDSLSAGSFDAWVGNSGSSAPLTRCTSKGTDIKIVAP